MLSVVPMLQEQRDLLDIPRGLDRFRRYLGIMTNGAGEVVLPLAGFNPMSKAHVAESLDALIGLGAEDVASGAVAEAERRLGRLDIELRVGLVVSDDVAGGWTDRELIEANRIRFEPKPMLKRGWLVVPYWASEPVSEEKVREEVLSGVYRDLCLMRHDPPKTLRQMMGLEGMALAFAGAAGPTLDGEELAYTREVVRLHLDSDDFPTAFACLFGDEAARRVGYTPLGLSPRAGLALALAEARGGEVAPEAAFLVPIDTTEARSVRPGPPSYHHGDS